MANDAKCSTPGRWRRRNDASTYSTGRIMVHALRRPSSIARCRNSTGTLAMFATGRRGGFVHIRHHRLEQQRRRQRPAGRGRKARGDREPAARHRHRHATQHRTVDHFRLRQVCHFPRTHDGSGARQHEILYHRTQQRVRRQALGPADGRQHHGRGRQRRAADAQAPVQAVSSFADPFAAHAPKHIAREPEPEPAAEVVEVAASAAASWRRSWSGERSKGSGLGSRSRCGTPTGWRPSDSSRQEWPTS